MEEFFTWRDEWSTGIEALDSQHVELTRQLNRVVCACSSASNQGQNDETVGSEPLAHLADGLHDHIKAHFRDEEQMMLDVKYPDYTAHTREHTMLLAELRSILRMESARGAHCISAETLRSLKSWFIAHIIHSDRAFGTYLLSRNAIKSLSASAADSN